MTVERIELNDPVTPNEIGLECECMQETPCYKLFAYIEAYQEASKWIDKMGKEGYEYYVIVQGCTNPRHGNIVAYVDYKGAILASVYAEEWKDKE